MARFKVSKARIDEAREVLGVKLPVVVRIVRYGYAYGGYIGERDGQHRIGVDHRLSARAANRTIWHELGHVLQAERLGGLGNFDAEFDRQLLESGVSEGDLRRGRFSVGKYNRTPLEREAEGIAKAHKGLRLTERRTRRRRRKRRGSARRPSGATTVARGTR